MIHTAHAAVIHTHVAHGNQWTRVGAGYWCTQPFLYRKGAARIASAIHGLCKHGIRLFAVWFDDHVVGLGHGDTELVDADRFDVQTIGRNHSHLQARDAHIEIGHRRGVDEAQADLFAWFEYAGPVAIGCLAIHQVGVGVATDVSEIRRAHLHLGPHLAIGYGGGPTHLAYVIDEVTNGAFVLVVVVRLFLELGQYPRWIFIRPVAQQHDVITVVTEGLGLLGIDDQRAVYADLLLQPRVTVIPVGTVLVDLELVLIHAVRGDAMEAQARNTIHVRRQDDAVPMDGGVLLEAVAHAQCDGIAFAPTKNRPRERAVDGHGRARCAGDVHRGFTDE